MNIEILIHMGSAISKRRNETNACPCNNEATDTYTVLGMLVGAGIDQQPHTVRVTMISGILQCCAFDLRVELTGARTESMPSHTRSSKKNAACDNKHDSAKERIFHK